MLFKHIIINEKPEDEYKLDHIPETKKVIDWDWVTGASLFVFLMIGVAINAAGG